MITNVSRINNNVSFGLAKLSENGIALAQNCGYPLNTFVNEDLYKKPKGLLKKTALYDELIIKGKPMTAVAQNCGCTQFSQTNAKFMKAITSKKAQKVLAKIYKKYYAGTSNEKTYLNDVVEAYKMLLDSNYDNPAWSAKDAKKLVDKLSIYLPPESYYNLHNILRDAK